MFKLSLFSKHRLYLFKLTKISFSIFFFNITINILNVGLVTEVLLCHGILISLHPY